MTWRVTLAERDLNKAPMTEVRDEHGRLTVRDLNKAPMTWRVTNTDECGQAPMTELVRDEHGRLTGDLNTRRDRAGA